MDGQLDKAQARKAVQALLQHAEKERESGSRKADLIKDEEPVTLVVATTTIPPKPANKPLQITLPHPITEGHDVCLFTKDPQREYKDKVAAQQVTRVTRVIGISKLRKKFKPYEAKRQLCNSFDIFMADARIVPLLPNLLGKHFFDRKKQPIPVDLNRKNLKPVIEEVLNSTYMYYGKGASNAVKVGRTDQSADEVYDNLLKAVTAVSQFIAKKGQKIQSLHIKTTNSVALPIYVALPTAPPAIQASK